MNPRILAVMAILLVSCAAPIPEKVSAKESAANLRWFRKHYLDADLTEKLSTTQIVYDPLSTGYVSVDWWGNVYISRPLRAKLRP